MKILLSSKIRPDAVFCANDAIACGAYNALNAAGLKIPDDVAVAGFGNQNVAKFMNPSLTTVDQNPLQMGRIAAKTLIELLINDNKESGKKINTLETKLIVRQST